MPTIDPRAIAICLKSGPEDGGTFEEPAELLPVLEDPLELDDFNEDIFCGELDVADDAFVVFSDTFVAEGG